MVHFQEFNCLLRKLQHSAGPSEAVAALKDVATALRRGDKNDLQELLSLLNSTPDHELKVKLLSVLSAYLISHNKFSDVIVIYRPLYDTIQNLLIRCLPVKAKTTLNFILALLTADTETGNLKLFARNMLRVSGCLMTMCDLFTSGMMFQDTWIALCQSIAESCSECKVNQNFCSHLIPVCVERCRQGNTDVCIVLQCLVRNHQRNVQLFFESGGQTIFTRQLLQHDTCMQMLSNVVQTSEQAVQFLYSSGLVHHLRDLLCLYGPYSQVGQWSTIILYRLDNRIKGSENTVKNMASEVSHDFEALAHSNLNLRHSESKQNPKGNVNEKQYTKTDMDQLTKDAITFTTMEQHKRNSVAEKFEKTHSMNDINKVPIDDDTINLFQNVIREVISWKSKNELNPNKPFNPIAETNKCHRNDSQNCKAGQGHKLQNTETRVQERNNLSFADFSREYDIKRELLISFPANKHFDETGQTSNTSLCFTKVSNSVAPRRFLKEKSKAKHNEINIRDFRPAFVSTPKRQRLNGNSIKQSKLQNKTNISYASQVTRHSRSQINKQKKLNKSKITQTTLDTTKDVKQRSMSARLFSAINNSCTTLVKSVKSIFITPNNDYIKKNKISNSGAGDKNDEADSCSYSFTNFMLKRDAVLENDVTQTENMEYVSNSTCNASCRTCKNTIVLQHKMATDENLQQTVKRLKIGVNLYGCNFKKISKTLWPRNRYMTPNILYNLYRKLIINNQQKKFPDIY